MKVLTINSITVDGSSVTIDATVSDATLGLPAQQQTINITSADNPLWTRNGRVSDLGFFVLRTGSNPFAVLAPGMLKLAATLEPTLSWLPRFSTQPANTTVAHGSNATLIGAVNDTDELTATLQWQRSTDGSTWANITGATTPSDGCTYSGYATAALTITAAAAGMNGYYYRVVATNAKGSTNSNAAALTVT